MYKAWTHHGFWTANLCCTSNRCMRCRSELLMFQIQMSEGRRMYASLLIGFWAANLCCTSDRCMSCGSELLLLQTQMSEGWCMYASPLTALPSGACCERFLLQAPQGAQCSCCRHSSLPHPACQVTLLPWFAFQSHVADLTLRLFTRPVCCVCSICP